VNDVNTHAKPKVVIGSRVSVELAQEVARLADAGDRTVSREVAAAIRNHVESERSAGAFSPPSPPPTPEGA
jgi:hypothetical protein